MRKWIDVLVLGLAVGGCSQTAPIRDVPQPPSSVADSTDARAPSATARIRPPVAGAATSQATGPVLPVIKDKEPLRPIPEAVFEILPGQDELSPESLERLSALVRELRADAQGLIRMEAYAPSSGSVALGIGIADEALGLVRRQLVRLGAPMRRIVFANFGEVASAERYPDRAWIEVHRVSGRPGSESGR